MEGQKCSNFKRKMHNENGQKWNVKSHESVSMQRECQGSQQTLWTKQTRRQRTTKREMKVEVFERVDELEDDLEQERRALIDVNAHLLA